VHLWIVFCHQTIQITNFRKFGPISQHLDVSGKTEGNQHPHGPPSAQDNSWGPVGQWARETNCRLLLEWPHLHRKSLFGLKCPLHFFCCRVASWCHNSLYSAQLAKFWISHRCLVVWDFNSSIHSLDQEMIEFQIDDYYSLWRVDDLWAFHHIFPTMLFAFPSTCVGITSRRAVKTQRLRQIVLCSIQGSPISKQGHGKGHSEPYMISIDISTLWSFSNECTPTPNKLHFHWCSREFQFKAPLGRVAPAKKSAISAAPCGTVAMARHLTRLPCNI